MSASYFRIVSNRFKNVAFSRHQFDEPVKSVTAAIENDRLVLKINNKEAMSGPVVLIEPEKPRVKEKKRRDGGVQDF